VRGLEVDGGVVAAGGGGELFFAGAGFGGQESAKIKRQGRQAASHQGMEDGGGAGDDLDGKIFPAGGADDAFAWIRNAGHAAVRDEGNSLTGTEPVEQGRLAGGFVEFLVTEEGFFQAEMLQKQAGATGVLGGDEIGRGEGLPGTGGEIGKIADGGPHDEKTADAHGTEIRIRMKIK